jgi:hypothetical protein
MMFMSVYYTKPLPVKLFVSILEEKKIKIKISISNVTISTFYFFNSVKIKCIAAVKLVINELHVQRISHLIYLLLRHDSLYLHSTHNEVRRKATPKGSGCWLAKKCNTTTKKAMRVRVCACVKPDGWIISSCFSLLCKLRPYQMLDPTRGAS